MNIAAPSTSGLVVGEAVTTVIERPLVVDGNTPDCAMNPPAGTVCESASFVKVTVIPGVTGDTTTPPATTPVLSTVAYDSCGVIDNGGQSACPRIEFNFFEPPNGDGTPPPGFVGVPYVSCKIFEAPDTSCKPFQFEAFSTRVPDEGVTFQLVGTPPPGLHVSTDGILSGTPSTAGQSDSCEERGDGTRLRHDGGIHPLGLRSVPAAASASSACVIAAACPRGSGVARTIGGTSTHTTEPPR